MRKKIASITRPDPAYAASLRPKAEADPGRGEAERAETVQQPVSVKAHMAEAAQPQMQSGLSGPPDRTSQETAAAKAPPSVASPPRIRRMPATRKIDIRVNALERQEEALIDCGVDPAHVIRAALRRAVKDWQLAPDFVAPSEEQRTQITEWRARTSLAVDTAAVATLLREQDPLDVLSKWTLIRGQVEPRVWAEIDALLEELSRKASAEEGGFRTSDPSG